MAVGKHSAWVSLHLLTRVIGITGVVTALVGLFLWYALPSEPYWQATLAGAGLAVAIALVFELRGTFRMAGSTRGAVGISVVLQVLLALVLAVGVNVFSFSHYRRFDLTTERQFTLPAEVQAQLAGLRDATDIVVLLQHISFGQRAHQTQDQYEVEAERKIIEKVKDLAEQFQDLGPRFRVQVLDVQDKRYKEKLDEIGRQSPALAEAIKLAPEDSIFFHTKGASKVQRLSFSDVYQLDKKASLDEQNLVLRSQGVGPIARKIFNIEERRPKVAFAVVHEILGLDGGERTYSLMAVKKIFATRGFEGRDIILKRWDMRPEPIVAHHDENRYDELEERKAYFEGLIKLRTEDRDELLKQRKRWAESSLEDLNKEFAVARASDGRELAITQEKVRASKRQGIVLLTRPVTEAFRQAYVREYDEEDLAAVNEDLRQFEEELETVRKDMRSLRVEDLQEQRRVKDLRARMNRLLADVDLLVIPRKTIDNILKARQGGVIPYAAHKLDDNQVEAIKDYIRSGRPVLFCIGPPNLPETNPLEPESSDGVDDLLASLGVEMPSQTILYDVDTKAMTDALKKSLIAGALPEAPALAFDWDTLPGVPPGAGPQRNPVRTSLKLAARGFGTEKNSDLKLHYLRPIYRYNFNYATAPSVENIATAIGSVSLPSRGMIAFAPMLYSQAPKVVDEASVILGSAPEGWNEDQPYPTEKRIPRYERPKATDTNKGTLIEKRKGVFPVAVAFETQVPRTWYTETAPPQTPPTVRMAVLGQGDFFTGDVLSPMREKLLLDVSNWLLGRDDLLAREEETWQYPRIQLDPLRFHLWQWGVSIGLPVVIIYVGIIVLLFRQMR